MKILLVEPFFTGSHAVWAEGYREYSNHEVKILSLKGRHWKWRMHGGAVSLAREFLESEFQPDLILATDMLDLSAFLSLSRKKSQGIPAFIYFHENQLTYPWSPSDQDIILKRDNHYSFLNFTSALSAEQVYFNSSYHLESFLGELPRFLKQFPDYQELAAVEQIRKKAMVLHLGMDLKRFDAYEGIEKVKGRKPLILWNHRWEYDKNPKDFFNTLYDLAAEGLEFELALLGERFRKVPREFEIAKEILGNRIVQFGYAESFSEYAKWLHRSDFLPVSSNQDFFGGSVVEAMYCGCTPILPNRLAYPEHIPAGFRAEVLYINQEDFKSKLRSGLNRKENLQEVKKWVSGYDWSVMAGLYDQEFGRKAKEDFTYK